MVENEEQFQDMIFFLVPESENASQAGKKGISSVYSEATIGDATCHK